MLSLGECCKTWNRTVCYYMQEKMLDIIQTAFGDLGKFNDAVKAILDDIQWTTAFEEDRYLEAKPRRLPLYSLALHT